MQAGGVKAAGGRPRLIMVMAQRPRRWGLPRPTSPSTNPRSSSGRTLSLPAFLLDELAQHLSLYRSGAGRYDHVFTGAKGGTLRRSFAARVFNPAVARAGLPDELTFHGLRHVAASFLVDAGEHPRVIQHRLGHATARLSMELYAHVPETTDRDVASHLDTRFSRERKGRRAGEGSEADSS